MNPTLLVVETYEILLKTANLYIWICLSELVISFGHFTFKPTLNLKAIDLQWIASDAGKLYGRQIPGAKNTGVINFYVYILWYFGSGIVMFPDLTIIYNIVIESIWDDAKSSVLTGQAARHLIDVILLPSKPDIFLYSTLSRGCHNKAPKSQTDFYSLNEVRKKWINWAFVGLEYLNAIVPYPKMKLFVYPASSHHLWCVW